MSGPPLTTISFSSAEIAREQGEAARVEVELLRSQYPQDEREVFQPLRIPDHCRVGLIGPLLAGLRHGVIEGTVHFRAGLYNLPLGSGPPCHLELEPETQGHLQIELECPAEQQEPVIRSARLRLHPPVIIYNVLQTLSQLHELIEDRYLAVLKPLLPNVPAWLRLLGEKALGTADTKASILLEEVLLQPGRGSSSSLRLLFSGRIRWLEQVETVFHQLALPTTLVPLLHGALSQLLSADPLASADLVASPQHLREMAQTILDLLQYFEPQLTFVVEPPPVKLKTTTIAGTSLEIDFSPPRRLQIAGELLLEVEKQGFRLKSKKLSIKPDPTEGKLLAAGERAPSEELHLDLSGSGELKLHDAYRPWSERLSFDLDLQLAAGSRWSQLSLGIGLQERIARGNGGVQVQLDEAYLQGGIALAYDGQQLRWQPSASLQYRLQLHSGEPFWFENATGRSTGQLQITSEGDLRAMPDGEWQGHQRIGLDFNTTLVNTIARLPELDLDQGQFSTRLAGQLELDLTCSARLPLRNVFDADLTGSRFLLQLNEAELQLPPRWLTLPAGTTLTGQVQLGHFTAAGLQGLAVLLGWDLSGQHCLLHHQDQAISLLTEELRQGQMTLHLDETGQLCFAGNEEGLYGARYFNTLINPAGDPEHLLTLFLDEDAIAHVVAAISVFAPKLAEALSDLRALYFGARHILAQEQIKQVGDFVPRAIMARLFSILLSGDSSRQEKLAEIIKKVTTGEGLDRGAAREILLQELAEYELDYEINALLHWIDLVLSPSEPVEAAPADHELPLTLDPAYAEARNGLPSANEIYAALRIGAVDHEWANRLAGLAPYLTRQQLGFILERSGSLWDPADLSRLRYAFEIKKRVEVIAESYGGVEYLLQPLIIASFLGEAVGPLPGINHPVIHDPTAWPPPCALGPEEVAVLLQAGLATGRQNRQSQKNNRLLLELMQRQPADFTREVFIELGHQSPRALCGILFAFLDQDQDQLAQPLDLVDFLHQRLGIPVPRQQDYMAGGHKARQSYYEALSRLADQVIAEANPYLARKAHLQVLQHPVPAPVVIRQPEVKSLEQQARAALDQADTLGHQCSFDSEEPKGPLPEARQAYLTACRRCAELLAREPRAWQLAWLKQFWLRNEEALRVLSVVRNYQQDIDQVRRWLQIRAGQPLLGTEQDILGAVVRHIYWQSTDQQAVLTDPLARLLIDPPAGHYHFSIVSCMGVITDGKDGAELEDAFRRLNEQRGIRIIRAHTGIARSLEHNADRIIEAIEDCQTPWGIIGYSQGCANALLAESLLYGGTPDQQRLLEGLVCRNLLFSAANGSAHGTSGMIKFARALVQGERFLKHYQAIFSWEAIQAALRVARAVLDSKVFVGVLGGAHSLSFERARLLHREGQFLDRVPTSLSRAVVSEAYLPEVLEYLYYVLKVLTRGAPQDTQVLITDAVGHSTQVINERTAVLARCDLTSFPLATHHWAPLTREVEFVTTARDHTLGIYQGPKDYLVWPWIEVNARFGRISPPDQ